VIRGKGKQKKGSRRAKRRMLRRERQAIKLGKEDTLDGLALYGKGGMAHRFQKTERKLGGGVDSRSTSPGAKKGRRLVRPTCQRRKQGGEGEGERQEEARHNQS